MNILWLQGKAERGWGLAGEAAEWGGPDLPQAVPGPGRIQPLRSTVSYFMNLSPIGEEIQGQYWYHLVGWGIEQWTIRMVYKYVKMPLEAYLCES